MINSKRKHQKASYRKALAKKIVRIIHVEVEFYDSLMGTDKKGRGYQHFTNFSQWRRPIYEKAIKSYHGPGKFGLSESTLAGNIEEGEVFKVSDMGALFARHYNGDMTDFWNHVSKVETELTRATRRELQKRPSLKNNTWLAFRRPRA